MVFSKSLPWSRMDAIAVVASVALCTVGWIAALVTVDNDVVMGSVYRIIYVHVPCAWNAFLWAGVGAIKACQTLVGKNPPMRDMETQAAMEMATVFSFLALATGSIWGRPTWGVWWDWDPRLTTTLIMFLTTCSYMLIRQLSPNPSSKRQTSSVVAILSAANVPLVYFSVNLWRSLHQPQTFTPGARNASTDIAITLWYNVFAMVVTAWTLYKLRYRVINIETQLSNARAGNPLPWQLNNLSNLPQSTPGTETPHHTST